MISAPFTKRNMEASEIATYLVFVAGKKRELNMECDGLNAVLTNSIKVLT